MFLGFSKTLHRMSGFRIGAGFRLNKWWALFVIFFFAMFYMMWWSILLCGWLVYGVCFITYKFIKWCVDELKALYNNNAA